MQMTSICKNGRFEIIDYIKGIGIILMVLAHAGGVWPDFIYVFHMSLFFICAGYCYKGTDHVFKFLGKKVRSLYFPFVLWGMAVNVCNHLLNRIHILEYLSWREIFKNIRQTFLFHGGTIISFQNWFLRTMFFSLMLFQFLHIIARQVTKSQIKQNIIVLVVSAILLVIGWIAGKYSANYDWNICSSVVMLEIGYLVNRNDILTRFFKGRHVTVKAAGIFLIIAVMSRWRIELSQNIIINPLFFMVGGLLGFLLCASCYLVDDSVSRKKRIAYVGRHSLWILVLHLLAFKLVTIIQILIFDREIDELGGVFAAVYIPNWWIIYTLVGVYVPILICKLYIKLQSVIKSTLKGNTQDDHYQNALSCQLLRRRE